MERAVEAVDGSFVTAVPSSTPAASASAGSASTIANIKAGIWRSLSPFDPMYSAEVTAAIASVGSMLLAGDKGGDLVPRRFNERMVEADERRRKTGKHGDALRPRQIAIVDRGDDVGAHLCRRQRVSLGRDC